MAKLRIASRLNLDALSADEKKCVKAIGYSLGSLTRLLCTCGYVSDCIQDECPQCKAPVSRYNGRFKKEVVSLQKNTVCIAPHMELLQTERTFFVACHASGDSEVVIRSRQEVSNSRIEHLDAILVENGNRSLPEDQRRIMVGHNQLRRIKFLVQAVPLCRAMHERTAKYHRTTDHHDV